jgi:FtsH-binding integral membrane protein
MTRRRFSWRNAPAVILAVVAGILLILSGGNGVETWESIRNFVTAHIMDNGIFQSVFVVVLFLASLGGVVVIAGGVFIGQEKIRAGKFLISLGTGVGLIGLLSSIVVAYVEQDLHVGSFLSVGAVGVILSIAARVIVKRE